jgi:hypothetical protein
LFLKFAIVLSYRKNYATLIVTIFIGIIQAKQQPFLETIGLFSCFHFQSFTAMIFQTSAFLRKDYLDVALKLLKIDILRKNTLLI